MRHSTRPTPALFTPEYSQQPYGVLSELRRQAPAHQVVMPNGMRVWLVTRYEEARTLLADGRLRRDAAQMNRVAGLNVVHEDMRESAIGEISAIINYSDPPDHVRVRTLAATAFTARRVARLRPRITAIATELLDAAATGQPLDLIEAFARPLPVLVICELLGVPFADREAFKDTSIRATAKYFVAAPDVRQARAEITSYLADLIARKQETPGDDLLSALVHAVDGTDRLTAHELLKMSYVLLVAGFDTTVNLIGNGLLALLENPEQLRALSQDPSLLPGALDEFLRYESPVAISPYFFTAQPVEVGGITIPADQVIVFALNSANRDSDRFPHGDVFDITRAPGGHLAFGHGPHYCLGAPLARLEAEIAFGQLLGRFPSPRLAVPADEIRWRDAILMRGLEKLPVTLGV
jgi:cytochrome P450